MIASSSTSTSRWIQKPSELRPAQMLDRGARRFIGADAAHLLQVLREDGRRQRLAAIFARLLGVARTDHRDIRIAHQRTQAFDVGEDVGTAPCAERQVHSAASPLVEASG